MYYLLMYLKEIYLNEKKINLEKEKILVDNSLRDELIGLYNRKAIVPYFRDILNSRELND